MRERERERESSMYSLTSSVTGINNFNTKPLSKLTSFYEYFTFILPSIQNACSNQPEIKSSEQTIFDYTLTPPF